MDNNVHKSDPFWGFTFDSSELKRVLSYGNYTVGNRYHFLGLHKDGQSERESINGKILAIGLDAKYTDGSKFVAVIIEEDGGSIIFRNLEKLTEVGV